MAYKSYAEKLLDPRWQRKRLEILQRDNFACVHCNSTDKTLHVHHGYYERGVEPWEYENQYLWTLCEDCHESISQVMTDMQKSIAFIHPARIPHLSVVIWKMAAASHGQKIPDHYSQMADQFLNQHFTPEVAQ